MPRTTHPGHCLYAWRVPRATGTPHLRLLLSTRRAYHALGENTLYADMHFPTWPYACCHLRLRRAAADAATLLHTHPRCAAVAHPTAHHYRLHLPDAALPMAVYAWYTVAIPGRACGRFYLPLPLFAL